MSELSFADEVNSSALIISTKENIAARRTIVYQTLMDPTTVRIEGEKIKSKIFKRFLFRLNNPEEIECVSIEKYYEPYVVVSGRHLIDYYRKRAYSVSVDKEAKEVILLGHTFTPRQSSNSNVSAGNIELEGEERLVRETRGFIILDRYGQESKLSGFTVAPSEENPQKLVKAFKMPEIAPDMDLNVIRKRIVWHPNDISRIVDEELEIDERSIIHTPRFRLRYKCQRIGKEAYVEFDGVTLKQIKQNESVFSVAIDAVLSIPRRLFGAVEKWMTKKLQLP